MHLPNSKESLQKLQDKPSPLPDTKSSFLDFDPHNCHSSDRLKQVTNHHASAKSPPPASHPCHFRNHGRTGSKQWHDIPSISPSTFSVADTDPDALSSNIIVDRNVDRTAVNENDNAKRGGLDADIPYVFKGFDPNCPGGTGCP